MQRINNIEIKNFKSIRHAEIKDCRKVNVFIGYPNVGKSNILEAMSLFAVNQQTKLKDLIRLKETPTIFYNGFIENPLMVSLNDSCGIFGELSDKGFTLSYQGKSENAPFSSININPVLNQSLVRQMWFNEFNNAGYNNDFFEGREFAIKKYEFKKDVTRRTIQYSSLDNPYGENIFSILQTNEDLNKDASELLREYNLDFLFDNRQQEFTILKRTGTKIFSVPYELLADTLQRLIFYKAAVLSNKETVLLFEEPEAHMFPPYIAKFTSDIIFDKNDNQYFIATHSPFVLNDFMEDLDKEELSIYAVGLKDGETVVHRLTREEIEEVYQYGIDLFFNLENYLKDVV
jgi:AAA15 family ATPase/GTPase